MNVLNHAIYAIGISTIVFVVGVLMAWGYLKLRKSRNKKSEEVFILPPEDEAELRELTQYAKSQRELMNSIEDSVMERQSEVLGKLKTKHRITGFILVDEKELPMARVRND